MGPISHPDCRRRDGLGRVGDSDDESSSLSASWEAMMDSSIAFRPADGRVTAYLWFAIAASLPIATFWVEGFASAFGSLICSAALVFIALRDLGRTSDRRPRLVVDAEGLYVPGFFERTIPWAAIVDLDLYYSAGRIGAWMLRFDVDCAADYGPSDSHRLRTAFDQPGPVTQHLHISDFDEGPEQVFKAFERFALGRLERPLLDF